MALTKAHNRMISSVAANVKDFGAVGDGVADDTSAINLALASGALDVLVPEGTYLISGTLVVPEFCTFRGVGYGGSQSVIKQKDGANMNAPMIANKAWDDNASLSGGPVTLKDIFIDGNSDNNTGSADGCALMTYQSVVEGVQVFKATGNGIRITGRNKAGSAIGGGAAENRVQNCRVTRVKKDGIKVDPDVSALTDTYILNNTIGFCDENGISARAGSKIIGNHLYDTGFDGIAESAGFNSVMYSNKIEDWGQSATTGDYHAYVVYSQTVEKPSKISSNNAILTNAVSGTTYWVFGATFPTGSTTSTGRVVIDGNSALLLGAENTVRASGSGSGTVVLINNSIEGYTAIHIDNLGANQIVHYGNTFDKDFLALAGSGTPSVLQGCMFETSASTITYSNFTNGYEGQEIVFYVAHAPTTVDFTSSNLKGNAGVDWTPSVGDFMRCVKRGNDWLCQITDTTV